jgi:hypothetical protein
VRLGLKVISLLEASLEDHTNAYGFFHISFCFLKGGGVLEDTNPLLTHSLTSDPVTHTPTIAGGVCAVGTYVGGLLMRLECVGQFAYLYSA